MGWTIVVQSFLLLYRNPVQALKVSVGPALLCAFAIWLSFRLTGASPQMLVVGLMRGRISEAVMIALSLSVVAVIFASAWVAVAWHRFILAGEQPAFIPAVIGNRIAAYAGRSLLLSVLVLALVIPVAGVAGQILTLAGLAESLVVGTLFSFGMSTVLMFLWFRMGIVLPATATGADYPLAQGWNDAVPYSTPILEAAALLTLFNMIAAVLLDMLLLGFWPGMVIRAAILWLTMMLGSTVLAVLYRRIALRRRLN